MERSLKNQEEVFAFYMGVVPSRTKGWSLSDPLVEILFLVSPFSSYWLIRYFPLDFAFFPWVKVRVSTAPLTNGPGPLIPHLSWRICNTTVLWFTIKTRTAPSPGLELHKEQGRAGMREGAAVGRLKLTETGLVRINYFLLVAAHQWAFSMKRAER